MNKYTPEELDRMTAEETKKVRERQRQREQERMDLLHQEWQSMPDQRDNIGLEMQNINLENPYNPANMGKAKRIPAQTSSFDPAKWASQSTANFDPAKWAGGDKFDPAKWTGKPTESKSEGFFQGMEKNLQENSPVVGLAETLVKAPWNMGVQAVSGLGQLTGLQTREEGDKFQQKYSAEMKTGWGKKIEHGFGMAREAYADSSNTGTDLLSIQKRFNLTDEQMRQVLNKPGALAELKQKIDLENANEAELNKGVFDVATGPATLLGGISPKPGWMKYEGVFGKKPEAAQNPISAGFQDLAKKDQSQSTTGLPEVPELADLPQVPELPQPTYGKKTPTGQALARQRAETPPLPDLNLYPDEVPLLPDTPMPQLGQGERPLPTINPNAIPTPRDTLELGGQQPYDPRAPTTTQIPLVGDNMTLQAPLRDVIPGRDTVSELNRGLQQANPEAWRANLEPDRTPSAFAEQLQAALEKRRKDEEYAAALKERDRQKEIEYQQILNQRELQLAQRDPLPPPFRNDYTPLPKRESVPTPTEPIDLSRADAWRQHNTEPPPNTPFSGLGERVAEARRSAERQDQFDKAEQQRRDRDYTAAEAQREIQRAAEEFKEVNTKLGQKRAGRKQKGSIDPEVYREGFKRLTRALSRLTDQPWMKERFPANNYMTNSDGSPLVMLHGTNKEFRTLVPNDQGIHLGFTVPAHLIQPTLRKTVYEPNKLSRTFRERNPSPDANYDIKPVNIRPYAIKRGNYPMAYDQGHWGMQDLFSKNYFSEIEYPTGAVAAGFKEFLFHESQKNGGTLTPERLKWYENQITQMSTGQALPLFRNMLQEARIDGFFYMNRAENLRQREPYYRDSVDWDPATGKSIPSKRRANPSDSISFVTWDPLNIRSVFDPSPSTFVPKGQRGSFTPGVFEEGIKKVIDKTMSAFKSTTEAAAPERAASAMSRIPGMSGLVKNSIPEVTPLEKIIKKSQSEPDISPWNALIGGGIQASEIKQSTGIYGAHDALSTASKAGDFHYRTYVAPAQHLASSLKSADKQAFMQVLKEEAKLERRATSDELRGMGVSEKVIEAHEAFDNMMNAAHEAQNQTLVSLGKKPLSFQEGYFAAMWGGPWKTIAHSAKRDSNGNLMRDGKGNLIPDKVVWVDQTNTRARANAAKRWIEDNHGDIIVSEPEYSDVFLANKSNNIQAGLRDLLDLLGHEGDGVPTDPVVAKVYEAWKQFQANEAYSAMGQSAHFKEKTGVRGYKGDRPWLDSTKDTMDALKAQFTYAQNAFRWSELQKAVSYIKDLNKALEQQGKTNTVNWIRNYTRNHLGYGEAAGFRWFEAEMGKLFSKHIPVSASEVIDMARSAFYMKTLGVGNLPFSAISMVQPVFTGAEHVRLSGDGFRHNPVKTMWDSVYNGGSIVWQNVEALAPNAKLPQQIANWIKESKRDPFLVEMAQYARDNGIVTMNQFSDVRNFGRPVKELIENIGGINMVATEAASRANAFAGFVSHLKQSGMFPDNASIFKKAEELTNLTMVDYRHFERADLFNKAGVTGKALSTFQQFHVNQWNNLYRYGKLAAKEKQFAPLATFLFTQWTMAGLMGMFGVETLDRLWESMKPGLPDSMQHLGVKKAIVSKLNSWLAYGAVSTITGINLSSRMDAGTIVEPSLEGLFPFVSEGAKTVAKGAQFAMNPNEATGKELLYQMSPASVRGTEDALLFKRGERKNGLSEYGSVTDYATDRPTLRDQNDITARMYGFRTLKESAQKDLDFRSSLTDQSMKNRRSRYEDRFKQAIIIRDKEGAIRAYEDYVGVDGDPKNLALILKNMDRMHTTYGQKILIAARSSVTAAKKAAEYSKAQEHINKEYRE